MRMDEAFSAVKEPPREQPSPEITLPTYGINLQPILKDGGAQPHTIGYEVLSRFNVHHGISPEIFLRAANKFQHDCYIFEQACRFSHEELKSRDLGKPYLSVNFSAKTLSEPTLIPHLKDILNCSKVTPADIMIEILEEDFPHDQHAIIMENLHLLHAELGLKLAIDDYGTGASNNQRVRDLLPYLHAIKIDKSLVNDEGLEELSRDPDIKGTLLIFEGVESDRQFALIRNYFGHQALQGFGFHRPLSEEAAVNHAQKRDTYRYSLPEHIKPSVA